jgi:3-oxoacyl-[acyl-carrier protein] reductase
MDFGIAGRVALVTGASGGLGFGVAKAPSAEGERVGICSRDRDRIKRAAIDVGPERRAFVADFHGAVSRASIIALVEEALGSIEILVINSGGPSAGRFEVPDDDRWADVVDQHVLAAATLLRTELPGMRARRWGRIVMVTSCSVKQPSNEMILSNTSRAALVGFARTLANEADSDDVSVNNIMPGYTRTPRIVQLSEQISKLDGRPPEAIVAEWEREIPMRSLVD